MTGTARSVRPPPDWELAIKALQSTVEDWLSQLRAGNNALRENMINRMNEIIQTHYRT